MDQGSTRKRSAVYNVAPTVTKFCVMWEGQALPHDTKFGNCRCETVDRRMIFIWSLIHGSSWSGLIKAEPVLYFDSLIHLVKSSRVQGNHPAKTKIQVVFSETREPFQKCLQALKRKSSLSLTSKKTNIFQYTDKILCMKFQRVSLKFHKIQFLHNVEILRTLRFESSHAFWNSPRAILHPNYLTT